MADTTGTTQGSAGGAATGAAGTEGATQGGAAGGAASGTAGAGAADLQAQVAALTAKLAATEAAQAKAAADAAAAAEAERVSKLSAEQRVAEELAKARGEIDATRAELVTERRALALERMGILPHFREYAPAVDPKTPEGAAALEAWVRTHPEAVAQRGAGAPAPVKPVGALAEVLSGVRRSPLLSADWASKLVSKING